MHVCICVCKWYFIIFLYTHLAYHFRFLTLSCFVNWTSVWFQGVYIYSIYSVIIFYLTKGEPDKATKKLEEKKLHSVYIYMKTMYLKTLVVSLCSWKVLSTDYNLVKMFRDISERMTKMPYLCLFSHMYLKTNRFPLHFTCFAYKCQHFQNILHSHGTLESTFSQMHYTTVTELFSKMC